MKKILLVDSDIGIINIVKNMAILNNHVIYTALHGVEALEVIENHDIDCIVIDMEVDHVTGLDIIDLLRRNVRRPWIIATCDHSNSLTAYPLLELAILIGADEVLAKPYCPEQLLDKLPASCFEKQKMDVGTPIDSEQSNRNLIQHSVAH